MFLTVGAVKPHGRLADIDATLMCSLLKQFKALDLACSLITSKILVPTL